MLMGIVTKNTIMLVDFVGAGGELRAPIAIAVIGGLLASTLLSLLFIPAVYTITDDASQVVSSLFPACYATKFTGRLQGRHQAWTQHHPIPNTN